MVLIVLSILACLSWLISLLLYQPRALVSLLRWLIPEVLFETQTDRAVVALTLDDGPDDTVSVAVLDILRAHKVRATWFVIGSRATAYPEIFKRLRDEGHEVGNHFWDETSTWRMNRQEFETSASRTDAVLGQAAGPRLLRPAGGWFRPWAAEEARKLNYRLVLGSAYTSDPLRPPAEFMKWSIVRMARPGAILVLHVGLGRDLTVEVLPEIIDRVRAKGLEFVTVGQMLAPATGSR